MSRSAHDSSCAETAKLRTLLAEGQIPVQLRAENLDAEELRIHQAWRAGVPRSPVSQIKTAIFTGGGPLIWDAQDSRNAERLLRTVAAGYTIEDALPWYIDFPLPAGEAGGCRHERFFCLVLVGPRVGITRRRPGGGLTFNPDLET